jgi:cellulose 1,4-beta-cellobiosidase
VSGGTKYYYTVKATSSGSSSAASTEVSAITIPAAPTGLAATAGNAQVTLSWTASTGATSYSIYQGTTSGGESATAIKTGITTTSYTVTGLANGTKYYFTAKAVGSSGTSGASNEASAIPILSAPTGVTATVSGSSIVISWTAVSNATGYSVYRGTTSGGEGTTAIGTSTTTSYTDSSVTAGTTYYYTVKATSSTSASGASNEANATTIPSAPTGLTATAGNAQIALSWTASSGAASYNVYQGTTAGGESATAIKTGISTTAYTVTGLTNGTKYYFTIKAVDTGGTSAASNEAAATPQLSAPTGLTATAGNAQVILSWT